MPRYEQGHEHGQGDPKDDYVVSGALDVTNNGNLGNLAFVHACIDSNQHPHPHPHLHPHDVLVPINHTGICGSDAYFWQHGAIGHFVVKDPLVLGHESVEAKALEKADTDSQLTADTVADPISAELDAFFSVSAYFAENPRVQWCEFTDLFARPAAFALDDEPGWISHHASNFPLAQSAISDSLPANKAPLPSLAACMAQAISARPRGRRVTSTLLADRDRFFRVSDSRRGRSAIDCHVCTPLTVGNPERTLRGEITSRHARVHLAHPRCASCETPSDDPHKLLLEGYLNWNCAACDEGRNGGCDRIAASASILLLLPDVLGAFFEWYCSQPCPEPGWVPPQATTMLSV